jgi:hypothetical protein
MIPATRACITYGNLAGVGSGFTDKLLEGVKPRVAGDGNVVVR